MDSEGPDMVDPTFDPRGFNSVPNTHSPSGPVQLTPYQAMNAMLAGRLHIVVIVGVVLYFVVTWAYQRWSNYYKPPPPNPSAMLRNIEAMHEARKRQIEAAKAALAVDAEKERERRERAVEEQRHNTDVRNGIYEDAAKLGGASASSEAAAQHTQKPKKMKRVCRDDGCYLVEDDS